MSLQVWLPLNGDLNNYGLTNTTVTNNGATSNSSGKIGSCYSFNGSSNYLTMDVKTSKSMGFCCWVYFNSLDNGVQLIDCRNSSGVGYQPTYISSSLIQVGNSQNSFAEFSYSFSTGKWYHIAVTNDESKTWAYINGVSLGYKNIGGYDFGTLNITIGARCSKSVYFLNGKMNDVRIYNHCLSAAEIKEISQGLVLHYPLREPNNLIVNSYKITGGSNSSGLTTEYMSNGSMKVVANGGSWRHCLFSNNEKTVSNFQNIPAGSKITISYDLFIESGTLSIPSMFLNAQNGYSGFSSTETLTTGKWIRVYQNRTYNEVTDPSSYSYFSMHLNFGGLTGTYYVRAFKAEYGTTSNTTWGPSISDYYSSNSDLVIQDCSGYNNNGTITGIYTIQPSFGRNKTCVYMKSTNIGTSTPTGAAFIRGTLNNTLTGATAITVAWWANIENYSFQNSGILSLSTESSYPTDYLTSMLAQYDSVFRVNNISGSASNLTSTTIITTGSWHHYALTYDGAIYKAYRDGILVSSTSFSGALKNCKYVYLGINVAGGAYRQTTGSWSDFRIYTTALSADDVARLYKTSASVDKSKKLHCYELVEE